MNYRQHCALYLSDVCELIPGFAFKSKDFGDYTFKAVKIADITPPNVDYQTLGGVDIQQYDARKLKKFLIRAGDYVLAMTGATIGKIGRLNASNAYINQRVLAFRPNVEKVDKCYLYYQLCLASFQNHIQNYIDSDTAQANISATSIGKYSFLCPPLPEQRAIAATLSCLDDKIELNNRMNKTLEEIAQAIFKSWFVDFEPFQDSEFVDSELGRIPKGWRVGVLADLLDVKYGKDHKKLPDGDIPVYGSGGLMRYADKAIFTGESVLIPRKGTLSNLMYVNEAFWTVDTMFYTVMKCETVAKYVYQSLLTKDLANMNAGSAVPSMTTDILNHLPVIIPSSSTLDQFDSILAPLYACITSNRQHIAKLVQIRSSLLPKLMSGEIHVPLEVQDGIS